MDLSIELNLDPIGHWPTDLIAWALQTLPVAFAVYTEHSGQRLARVSYFFSLILRALGIMILGWIALSLTSSITGLPSMSDFFNPQMASRFWPLAMVAYALNILFTIVLTRALVRRLRDAGIAQKWGYLAMLPFVDWIMYAGLIFYPPSLVRADQPAPTIYQH
jgi:uncharacterized membrane protein YhaH (DUF805 family)